MQIPNLDLTCHISRQFLQYRYCQYLSLDFPKFLSPSPLALKYEPSCSVAQFYYCVRTLSKQCQYMGGSFVILKTEVLTSYDYIP